MGYVTTFYRNLCIRFDNLNEDNDIKDHELASKLYLPSWFNTCFLIGEEGVAAWSTKDAQNPWEELTFALWDPI